MVPLGVVGYGGLWWDMVWWGMVLHGGKKFGAQFGIMWAMVHTRPPADGSSLLHRVEKRQKNLDCLMYSQNNVSLNNSLELKVLIF